MVYRLVIAWLSDVESGRTKDVVSDALRDKIGCVRGSSLLVSIVVTRCPLGNSDDAFHHDGSSQHALIGGAAAGLERRSLLG